MSRADTPVYITHRSEAGVVGPALLDVWRASGLGKPERMRAKLAWFYKGCPFGEPVVQMLFHQPSADWVGACAVGRRRMVRDGEPLRSGVIVDLAVTPDHRSMGPALIMQQGLLESALDELDMVLGFPNRKAAPLFKRLGCQQAAELVRHVCPLRRARYLRRRMPAWLAGIAGGVADLLPWLGRLARLTGTRVHARWAGSADPRIDTLWARSAPAAGLCMVRDLAHARWRLDQSLDRGCYLLLEDRPGGELQAWFAVREDDRVLHVLDFWSLHAGRGMERHHIDALLHAADAAGHEAVSVWMAASEQQLRGWTQCGFVARERRPVFARFRAGKEPAAGKEPVFLTAADEDE